ISETEYRHQVEEDIKPFRDVLLGLFFITVGMLLNIRLVLENWWLVLLLLVIPVLLKFGLIAVLARLFGASPGVAIRTGLGLAQAGEFGFVLLTLIGGLKLVDPFLVQLVLASMVLSMLLAPFMLSKMDVIALKFSANEWMMQSVALTQIAARSMNTQRHVVIAGFGRSGQSLARLLEEEGIAYHALDLDPERVQEAQGAGASVSYGDASRRESLVAAGIHRAAALIITYADTASALKLLHHAHELAPMLPVVVRSYDDSDIEKLMAGGASEVVPEAIEGSLMLASHALLIMGVPLRKVVHRVQAARGERYVSLRGYFHGQGDQADDGDQLNIRLHSVFLGQHARSIGRALNTLNLQELGAEITAIRRGKTRIAISVATVLEAGDIVVLRGGSEGIARAEARLLGA
ncbi:monovalent cation:proton antiporter family protein, partial [Lacisediminimonas sp.]|uniref:monovalent cation:proton antiporter family protein n=1 Tax=Lacisediminimonas sp. TaxID=3060582 RepID=UPI00271B0C7B